MKLRAAGVRLLVAVADFFIGWHQGSQALGRRAEARWQTRRDRWLPPTDWSLRDPD